MSDSDSIEVKTTFKIIGYAKLGIGSLNMLLFPANEVADATESDLGFLSDISMGFSIFGMVSGVTLFLKKQVDEHGLIKVFGFALLAVGFALWVLLFALTTVGSMGGVKKLGKKALKLLMPVCETVYGGYLIGTMIHDPEEELTVSNIGDVIHYLPSAISYTPLQKSPYYAIVILIRTGGLITNSVAGFIEMLENGNEEQKKLAEEMKKKKELPA
jgi:hypothetical protein